MDDDGQFGPESRQQAASIRHQRKAEVLCLMRLHGFSIEQACEIVCDVTPDEVLGEPPPPQSRIDYLPSPEQIWREAEAARLARPLFEAIDCLSDDDEADTLPDGTREPSSHIGKDVESLRDQTQAIFEAVCAGRRWHD